MAVAEDKATQKPAADVSTTTTIEGHYIPKDLEECFVTLQKKLGPQGLRKLKDGTETDLALYHLSLGMGLRNEWGLWKGSRLAKYFNAMGIFHPDDMSGIILTSFWRHLHGQPLKLDEQVATYQEYWKQAQEMRKAREIRER